MNKRIRELADEAWVYQVRVLNESDGSRTYTEKEKVFDKEKFAELIVRECMEQVWYSREDYINENISEVIKERMKEHFGVE